MTRDEKLQLRRELIEDIYDYSTMEREAARARQFFPDVGPFRWIIRLLEWAEASAARERSYLSGLLHRHYNTSEGDRDE